MNNNHSEDLSFLNFFSSFYFEAINKDLFLHYGRFKVFKLNYYLQFFYQHKINKKKIIH